MKDKNNKKNTEIAELGEFALIEHLTKNFTCKNKETKKGIGDDAAILDFNGKQVVVTTDLLVEGIHFNLVYTPLKHLGYKSAVVNFSDVYAMNAIPRQLFVGIAISARFSVEAVEEIYSGIIAACEQYGVDLAGGDTSSSLTGLMLSCTAVGDACQTDIVLRSGAKNTDLICVSGDLGAAYMGLQLLERERKIFDGNPNLQPKLEGYDYLLKRQLRPEARKDIIELFAREKIKPTAMIDISDGLSSELLHICKSSGTGCKVFEDKIPIAGQTRDLAFEMHIEPIIAAMNGGEDYELLFTVPIQEYEKIKNIQGISVIGHITSDPENTVFITKQGNELPLTAQGWKAF